MKSRPQSVSRRVVGAVVLCVLAAGGFPGGPLAAQGTTGKIAGRVLDEETGKPLTLVQVFVPSLETGGVTDVNGRYSLGPLPVGTYDLQVRVIGYARKTITGIAVEAGRTTNLDISLPVEAVAVEVLTVTVADERGTTEALLSVRKSSPEVTDAIGREQIAKSPDSDAAEALKRVPGITVVNGRFAYVRGLGERYGGTTLDGAPLPSPVPDKKAIPLDLIPAGFLESVSTAKTYLPDRPADYAGGLVQIRTRQIPGQRFFKLSSSTGFNTAASLRDGLGYAGGDLDFLGFDDGTRALPGLVPRDRPLSTGAGFSPEELERIGEAFLGSWGPSPSDLPVAQSFGLAFSQQVPIGGRELGVFGTANYSNDYTHHDDLVERGFARAGAEDPEVDYLGRESAHEVTLGGMLNAEYSVTPANNLALNLILNRSVEDQARVLEGFNLDSNTDQRNTRTQYLANTLLQSQLSGKHYLGWLAGGSTLKWRGAFSRASRYEPNTREVLYRKASSGRFLFDTFVQSGSIFHQELTENGYSGGLDLKLPFRLRGLPGAVSLGGAVARRDRDVYTRRFRFLPQGTLGDSVRALPPDELFSAGTVAPDSFQIQEATFRPDNYDAGETILAGYAMLEAEPIARLRLAGGIRVERAEQTVQPLDLFVEGLEPLEGADLDDTDLVPGANLTWAITDDMNFRLAASRTLARPEFRELAPFTFADFAGGFLVAGNPLLARSRISNFDGRWEWFPRPGTVLSVSGFHKFFDDPIEVFVVPSTELIKSWVNVEDATNYGAEFEVRSDLGFLGGALEHLTVNGNLTLVESEVNTGEEIVIFVPESGATTLQVPEESRALQGQSPYVINLGLSWFVPSTRTSATVLYNRFGQRIDAVGALALEDVFEEARDALDVVVEQPLLRTLQLKLSASRILGNEVEFTQGGDLLRSFDLGRKFSIGLSWWPVGQP